MQNQFAPLPSKLDQVSPPGSRPGKALRFFLRRYPVWPVVEFMLEKSVPQHRYSFWYSMGGLALFFLGLQFASGVLLMVYYQPSQPWGSVQRIVNEIPFGALIRSVHHWSANLMVLTVFLHLFSTFFMKAYRPPREFTWISGLALLGITLFFGFSGYLLPWDELSFFATRVGIAEVEKAPLIGPWLADMARGGSDVTIATIGRFYTLHVTVLPLAVLGILGAHLLFIQIQGVSEPDSFAALPQDRKKYHKFFPDFLLMEIPFWLCAAAVVVVLSVMLPRALGPEADPTAAAPQGIKPEWYFLSQYQLLKLFPGSLDIVGIACLALAPLAALIVPFADRRMPSGKIGRLAAAAGAVAVIAMAALTIWGWLS